MISLEKQLQHELKRFNPNEFAIIRPNAVIDNNLKYFENPLRLSK